MNPPDPHQASFDAFYKKTVTQALNRARRLTGNEADAWDITQDTYATAYKHWEDRVQQLNHAERYSYIRTTLDRNIWNASKRLRQGIQLHHRARWIQERPTSSTEQVALHSLELQTIWRLIAALPPRQRIIATLHWHDHASVEQIAEELGIHAPSVRSQLSKIRKKLKNELTAATENEDYLAEGGAW